jgi:hypothetical protein
MHAVSSYTRTCVIPDGHEEKEVAAVSSAEKERTEKESKEDVELKEEKADVNGLSSKESDDETLVSVTLSSTLDPDIFQFFSLILFFCFLLTTQSVWRKRTLQAT